MRFRVYFLTQCDGQAYPGDIVLEGDTVEDVREKMYREMEKRGAVYAGSDRLDEEQSNQSFYSP